MSDTQPLLMLIMPCPPSPALVFSRSLHNDASSRVVYSLAKDADQNVKESEKPLWMEYAHEAHDGQGTTLSKLIGSHALSQPHKAGEAILNNGTEAFSEGTPTDLEGLGNANHASGHGLASVAWTESGHPGKVVLEQAGEL